MSTMPSSGRSPIVPGSPHMNIEYKYQPEPHGTASSGSSEHKIVGPGEMSPEVIGKINIFDGGWDDDDDEDDYIDMAPIAPRSPRSTAVHVQVSESPVLSRFSGNRNHNSQNVTTVKSNDSGYYDTPLPDPSRGTGQQTDHIRGELLTPFVRITSPHGSIASRTSSIAVESQTPSPNFSTDDSDNSDDGSDSDRELKIEQSLKFTEYEVSGPRTALENVQNKLDEPLIGHRPRSGATSDAKYSPGYRMRVGSNAEDREGEISSPPPLPPRRTTSAGQAARKYLQLHRSNSRAEAPKSLSGLQRSSSRAGARGVQSRISKSRQVTSPTKIQKSSSQDIVTSPTDVNVKFRRQTSETISSDETRIIEAKRKSRTLDRDLGDARVTSDLTSHKSLEHVYDREGELEIIITDDWKRRSRDGSSVMKMLAERRKSRSLDPEYLQYLYGIAKHASSAPSTPSRQGSVESKTGSYKTDKKKKNKQNKIKDEECDDEEEYRKYAATMSAKSRSVGNGSVGLDHLNDDSLLRDKSCPNLADFATAHSLERAKAEKILKKKSHVVSKFSFRKSKTLGRTTTDLKEHSFAVTAKAFHEQLTKQGGVQNETKSDQKGAKSNSLKREKRKSWKAKRHGLSLRPRSKDRSNSDSSTVETAPETRKDFEDESGRKGHFHGKNNKANHAPVIKPSLGYDAASKLPPLGEKQAPRERATSFERSALENSPRIMSPAAGRSMTLGRAQAATGMMNLRRLNSSEQIQGLMRSMNSLNSENSGSNSDISIPFEEDLEDRRDRKAGTLSRLLGRKMKERRSDAAEFDDGDMSQGRLQELFNGGSLGRRRTKRGKSATLESPTLTLRMRHANSREALLDADNFFDPSEFVHGFRVVFDSDEAADISIEFDMAMRVEAGGSRINKYATITSSRSNSQGRIPLKKRSSDTAINNHSVVDGVVPSPSSRRNNSMPVALQSSTSRATSIKSWGIGVSSPRTSRRGNAGPSGHLPFSEVLTEDEVVGHVSDRNQMSPLRTRKVLQIVEPLHDEPSEGILAAARTLYRHLAFTQPDLLQKHNSDEERSNIRSHQAHHAIDEPGVSTYSNSVFGHDLVTWLLSQSQAVSTGQETNEIAASIMATWTRWNVTGMLQALLEDGAISHVRREHHFQDTLLLYQFHDAVARTDDVTSLRPVSVESTVSSSTINSDVLSTTSTETNDVDGQNIDDVSRKSSRSSSTAVAANRLGGPATLEDQELRDALSYLQNIAPDAMFRMVLRKLPEERSAEELMLIYEEILRIKALAHLSDSVKRELAGVLKFEFHRKRGKTLFSQGDEGRSWYIIVKGSVNVDIQGQGVVCTLHEGDDFGNLAIINDAPRAATIVLAEDNCQLLRVDKHDFVRILKDVEANTVRLKEHDKDVLILQKIHARSSSQDGHPDKYNSKTQPRVTAIAATPTRHNHRYAISAGTPAKIVEHIVKSLKPWSTTRQSDEAMEDLILMYQVFMSTQELCKQLMKLYQSERSERIDPSTSIKRKVVYFVVRWSHIATHIFYDQPPVGPFLKELKQAVTDDAAAYPNLKEDLARIYLPELSLSDSPSHRGWITVESSTVQRYPQSESRNAPHQAIKANDDVMLRVFNAHRTYTTVRLPIISTVSEIINAVAEKQGRSPENLLLIHVQSDGDMYVLPKNMTSAATSVGVNSRFFICSPDEKDDIEPLEEQHVIPPNNSSVLELASSLEIAEHMTQLDWELINSIHVMEFVHKVFGSHKFHSVTSNIDVFARRFNQLAYWAPTEICSCNNLNKRVHLLRKFIKIAQHLKELQNMNAFMAVIIGLGNQALSRLHSTWDKLPSKYKKMMTEFEAILDPSRNHRTYRLYVANLRPPLIPYLPLLMKDMTFQHEGNHSTRNELVNFEKMHMMSNSIRDVIHACSKPMELSHAVTSAKTFDESRQYARNFNVITDQKFLNQLSAKAEPKR